MSARLCFEKRSPKRSDAWNGYLSLWRTYRPCLDLPQVTWLLCEEEKHPVCWTLPQPFDLWIRQRMFSDGRSGDEEQAENTRWLGRRQT